MQVRVLRQDFLRGYNRCDPWHKCRSPNALAGSATPKERRVVVRGTCDHIVANKCTVPCIICRKTVACWKYGAQLWCWLTPPLEIYGNLKKKSKSSVRTGDCTVQASYSIMRKLLVVWFGQGQRDGRIKVPQPSFITVLFFSTDVTGWRPRPRFRQFTPGVLCSAIFHPDLLTTLTHSCISGLRSYAMRPATC